jgi:hypothetical protein
MEQNVEPDIEQNTDELKQLQNDYFLCLQVLLDDINSSKSLEKSSQNSDLSLAAQILQEECSNCINSFRLANAIQTSGSIPDSMMAEFAADSAQEENDRQIALRLANRQDRTTAETHDKNLVAAFGNLQVDKSFVPSEGASTR